MPRQVDSEQRVRDIVDAALTTLGEGGFAMLTLSNIAKRMGGSITLITHYFKNRDELIAAILEGALHDTETFVDSLESMTNPRDRLSAVLTWFLPLRESDRLEEGARIALVAHRHNEPAIQDFLKRLEPAMRFSLREAIKGFVPEHELESMVDLFRVWTSGVALSAVEHPEIWTAERQLATLELFLSHLDMPGLTDARTTTTGAS